MVRILIIFNQNVSTTVEDYQKSSWALNVTVMLIQDQNHKASATGTAVNDGNS